MKQIAATLFIGLCLTGCAPGGSSIHNPHNFEETHDAEGISLQLQPSPEGNYELQWPTREVFERIGQPYQSGDTLRALSPSQFDNHAPEITYAFHSAPMEDQGLYFQQFPTNQKIRTTLTEVDADLKPLGDLAPNVLMLSADPRNNKDIVRKFPFRMETVMPETSDALFILLTELVDQDGSVSDSIAQVFYIPGKVIHAELSTDKRVYSPGDELQLKTVNHGPTNLSHHGKLYDLEKQNPDGWERINEPPTAMTLEVYLPIPVGEYTQNITLPEDLQPGAYRIIKRVGADLTQYRTDLSAAFEIQ
ncbi:immunoglobulin-like domain-containing protein [Paenibacillus sp. strain BS8-2]